MLCTFTISDDRTLVVRSDDIKSIQDHAAGGCRVIWLAGSELHTHIVQGTAIENRDRIQQEELDLISRVNEHHQRQQQRMQQGYPAIPVPRGKR